MSDSSNTPVAVSTGATGSAVRHARDREIACAALLAESEAIRRLAESLEATAFGRAVDILLECKAQVVLTGMGKSGHIAAKIAATMASTGTPAFFMHPGEALHGDLGMLTAQNAVVALSQSGNTEEVLNLLPYIKHFSIPLIVVTGNRKSKLAQNADVVLAAEVEQEACPLNLAPTTSTTLHLTLGDALAIALMKRRGFTPDDFAMRHPLGTLGRRLLIRVADLMHKGDAVPLVPEEAPLREALLQITSKRLGMVNVVDAQGRLSGIFCDGDVRRLLQATAEAIDMERPIRNFMIRNPKHVGPDLLGVKAVDLMETHKITVMPVLDEEHKPIGTIHLHDLIRAGISP